MSKILRCPECGADESRLYAEQAAVIQYDVRADPDARDGIATDEPDVQPFKEWSLTCGECSASSDGGDSWTEGWLVDDGKGA